MNVEKVLAELRIYKTHLDECIGVFDRLALQRGERRGRPVRAAARQPPAVPARRKRKAGGKVLAIQSTAIQSNKDSTRSTKN